MSGTPLYNPNDNVTGRDGGPYLDEVEARDAEARRAVVEDREPDFDNPPATAGIPLVTAGRQAATVGVNNLPSQAHAFDLSNADLVNARSEDERHPAFAQRSEIPEDFDPDATESDSDSDDVEANPHDPNYVGSEDEGDVDESSDTDNDGEPMDFDDLGFDGTHDDSATE